MPAARPWMTSSPLFRIRDQIESTQIGVYKKCGGYCVKTTRARKVQGFPKTLVTSCRKFLSGWAFLGNSTNDRINQIAATGEVCSKLGKHCFTYGEVELESAWYKIGQISVLFLYLIKLNSTRKALEKTEIQFNTFSLATLHAHFS